MKIRLAQETDAQVIAELFHQLGYPRTPTQVRTSLADHIDQQLNCVFVAEINALVVGVVVLNTNYIVHVCERWARVSALVVDESARGRGVGAALLQQAQSHALKIGCTRIELTSNELRTRAHTFYEAHGFSEVRKRFVKMLGSSL